MTTSLKIKVIKKPKVKVKSLVKFPANVRGDGFLTVTKANGSYTFGVDYSLLGTGPVDDVTQTIVAVYDQISQSYKGTSISSIITGASLLDQHVISAGPVTVLTNARTVRVDQASGAAITLNMPAAADMISDEITIADWKGDASTHNITIVPNGSEKIQGQSSWTIAADNGSIRLQPVGGVGFVI